MSACGICGGNSRELVDKALAAGRSIRQVAAQFGVSKSAVARHHRNCKPESLLAANVTPVSAANEDITAEIARLRRAQATARRKGDTTAVLSISREVRAWVQMQTRAENAALGRPQEQPVSHAEALEMAKVLIEAAVKAADPGIIEWLREIVSWLSPNASCDAPEMEQP
jgi:transposase